ncbi:hypothetical protein [Pseudonocardia sp. NPDC049154]|uniref:hypothetical protein n=1 Tax=Pseudonocardia sp. NPDC049154 TaxID=3155501 RepID=UPI0033E79D58
MSAPALTLCEQCCHAIAPGEPFVLGVTVLRDPDGRIHEVARYVHAGCFGEFHAAVIVPERARARGAL